MFSKVLLVKGDCVNLIRWNIMLTYCIICGLYDGLLNKTFSNEVRNILKKR